jgi:hypothetical protein
MKNNFFVKALLLLVLVFNNQYSHGGGAGWGLGGLGLGLFAGAAINSASRPRYVYVDRYDDRRYYNDEDPIIIERKPRHSNHNRRYRR